MQREKPNKQYGGEFKQLVIETMRAERLGYRETEKKFGISNDRVRKWERIYLEEGPSGLYIERRDELAALPAAENRSWTRRWKKI